MKFILPIILFCFVAKSFAQDVVMTDTVQLSDTSSVIKVDSSSQINNQPESSFAERKLDAIQAVKQVKRRDPRKRVSPEEASENDSLIAERLQLMADDFEISLNYNEFVKEYIHAYAIQNADKISRILGEKAYFFPIFEDYLGKYQLPPELKYLAAVESALEPQAVSKSGAVGLWQFLPGTAGLFDLEINAWVDQRRDAYHSTDAACRYLEYLYRIYGDWHLVLASYNGGPGAVQKAITRAGGETNYWKLRSHISDQMQNYVPAFIAMAYVMTYYEDFNIQPSIPRYSRYDTDTIMVYDEITFRQISDVINLSEDILEYLNPTYRKQQLPQSTSGNILVLPDDAMIEFILAFEQIKEYKPEPQNENNKDKVERSVEVKAGDSLHKLAIRYHCTIDDILKWNHISRKYQLKAGEKLKVYVTE